MEDLDGWTPARAMNARRAAVHAWQEAGEAGAPPAERQQLWANVQYACEREDAVARPAPEPEAGQ